MKRVDQHLKEPWAFADEEARDLRKSRALSRRPMSRCRRAGARSRRAAGWAASCARRAWAPDGVTGDFSLDDDAYELLLAALLDVLVGANILAEGGCARSAARLQIQLRCAGCGSTAMAGCGSPTLISWPLDRAG